ncbi:MAG: endonuclease III [Phycisphaerales bacterium]|jgi:endonuclease III|nr:endonuclease III [Phycisphaerales bacterium]
MPRESKANRTLRTAELITKLKIAYPDAHCALTHGNPLKLLVATILSAQCTDKRVNVVTKTLFKKYKKPQDYASAEPENLENDIRSTGFYRNKAKNIRGACAKIISDFGGKVPRTMEQLLTLPGVARKTANCVLGNSFGLAEGVVVDTHVIRLSGRLGLTKHKNPVKIERDLMELVPQDEWILWSHMLIFHGRAVCDARKPDCENCSIAELCPSAGKL